MFWKNKKKDTIVIKTKESKLVNATPTTYSEGRVIAKEIMKGNVIVLDVSRCSKVDGMRIVDLLSGVLLAIKGDYRKLAPMTFILAPKTELIEKHYNSLINSRKQ